MTGVPALLAGAALLAAVLTVLRVRRRYLMVTVLGESMVPAYRPGERVLVRRTPAGSLRAGQVVVLRGHGAPGEPSTRRPSGEPGDEGLGRRWIIKRIAAAPGDPVPRATVPALRAVPGTRVPAGRLVVLGDNPERSHDSRQSGYFTADRVFGVVQRKIGS